MAGDGKGVCRSEQDLGSASGLLQVLPGSGLVPAREVDALGIVDPVVLALPDEVDHPPFAVDVDRGEIVLVGLVSHDAARAGEQDGNVPGRPLRVRGLAHVNPVTGGRYAGIGPPDRVPVTVGVAHEFALLRVAQNLPARSPGADEGVRRDPARPLGMGNLENPRTAEQHPEEGQHPAEGPRAQEARTCPGSVSQESCDRRPFSPLELHFASPRRIGGRHSPVRR